MDPKQLAKEYLRRVNIMQLATVTDNSPWICTVHFYADDALNFYWVSRTDRKHSQQLAKNSVASVTAVIHENTLDEDYVISVTAVGKAELATDTPNEIREAYVTKLNKPASLLPNPEDPNNLQEFYRLRPSRIIVFDTKNFLPNPRQEFKI